MIIPKCKCGNVIGLYMFEEAWICPPCMGLIIQSLRNENKQLRKSPMDLSREKLKSLLAQCTKREQGIFAQMYKSVDNIRKNQVARAIQQVQNTIEGRPKKVAQRLMEES